MGINNEQIIKKYNKIKNFIFFSFFGKQMFAFSEHLCYNEKNAIEWGQ